MIDGFLLQSQRAFIDLMEIDETTMRRLYQPWQHAPSVDDRYKPPVVVGQHALLAYPGTLIESIDEDASSRERVRILIKAADEGVIFNLIGWRTIEGIEWDWRSMEHAAANIRDECIKRLLARIKELVRVDIPNIRVKIEQERSVTRASI